MNAFACDILEHRLTTGGMSIIISTVKALKQQLPARDEAKRQKMQNAGVIQRDLLTYQQEVV